MPTWKAKIKQAKIDHLTIYSSKKILHSNKLWNTQKTMVSPSSEMVKKRQDMDHWVELKRQKERLFLKKKKKKALIDIECKFKQISTLPTLDKCLILTKYIYIYFLP